MRPRKRDNNSIFITEKIEMSFDVVYSPVFEFFVLFKLKQPTRSPFSAYFELRRQLALEVVPVT